MAGCATRSRSSCRVVSSGGRPARPGICLAARAVEAKARARAKAKVLLSFAVIGSKAVALVEMTAASAMLEMEANVIVPSLEVARLLRGRARVRRARSTLRAGTTSATAAHAVPAASSATTRARRDRFPASAVALDPRRALRRILDATARPRAARATIRLRATPRRDPVRRAGAAAAARAASRASARPVRLGAERWTSREKCVTLIAPCFCDGILSGGDRLRSRITYSC